MPEVFISHSSKDQAAAQAALAALEGRGISCWIAPRNIAPGREWGEALMEGIESCRVFLLLFSENANQSPQVRREVERAVHKGLIVVPVRLEDRLPQKALEYFISAAHWMDAFPEPFEAYLESLAEAVESLSGAGRAESDASVPASVSSRLPVPPEPTLVSGRKARRGAGVAGWLAVLCAVGIVTALGGWVSTKLRPDVPEVPPPDDEEVVPDLKPKVEMVPIPTSGVLLDGN